MLNEKIKLLRTAHGISQVQLAENLGVSKQCVSNWENDNVQPSIAMAIKIAQYFNVSTDYLFGLKENSDSVDVAGLDETEKAHIKLIIADIVRHKSGKR